MVPEPLNSQFPERVDNATAVKAAFEKEEICGDIYVIGRLGGPYREKL